jgi:hypothetical protein
MTMQQHGRDSPPPYTPHATIDPLSSTETDLKRQPFYPFTAGIPGSQMSLRDATPPTTDPTPQEAEALLSGALYGFSTEDRDEALADVHGVISAAIMDNEFIASRLAQLDQAISDYRSKAAYLRAKIQDPEYVSNRKFRLQFLMADNFQPHTAAERLVSFFESKLILFGPELLTRELSLDDLEVEDIMSLSHGVVQRLLGKDHAGRVVVSCWPTTLEEPTICIQNKVNINLDCAIEAFGMGHASSHDEAHVDFPAATSDQALTCSSKPVISWQLKAFWYLISTIVSEESQESQRNGIVLVIFGMGPRAQADRNTLWKLVYILRSLPIRVASVHFCYDDLEAKAIANLSVVALDRKSRARFRTHYGKFEMCVPNEFSNGTMVHLFSCHLTTFGK